MTSYTTINAGQLLLKRINGSGSRLPTAVTFAEINSVEVPSRPAPRKPTRRSS
jgi:hypothetical protein